MKVEFVEAVVTPASGESAFDEVVTFDAVTAGEVGVGIFLDVFQYDIES